MKKTQFKIGLLTACLISVSSIASAQSCGVESCDSKSCKCSKKNCDDKGLLEVINNAAGNFEATLANMIPDRDKPCAKAKCGCAQCSSPSQFAMQYTEITPAPPAPNWAPPMTQPDVVRPPMPRPMAPPNPVVDPLPHSGTHEVVPMPDSSVNPFQDEKTSRNLRAVPSRPASYLRPNINVKTDPQASSQKSMRSIMMSKAASKSISDAAHGLATTTSTRRTLPLTESVNAPVDQTVIEKTAPEVVPASLSVPLSRLRDPKPLPAAAEQFVNPLRAQ